MVNDTQQIPAGYKQTDVGVIPEDWDTSTLEEVSSKGGLVRGPFGGSLKKEMFKKSGYKVYEQRNAIYKNVFVGNYYVDEEKYRQLKRFSVQNNDFIVSCSGTIGKLFQIPKKHPAGIINQALLLMRLDPKKIDLDYFSHYFEWDKFQTRIIDNTQGGAMKNLVGMDVFRETLIPHPNQISEQSNIAKVLSDIDSLISKLDQLIQKKKNIKQGAMQELLTGKRRMPGFSGEWVEKKLGDLIDLKNGYSFKSDNYLDGGAYSIVTIANVQRGYMDASHFNKIARLPNDIQAHQKLSINDLLISMTGNVGRVCRVTLSNCLLNQRVGKIESKGLNELYLFYLLNRSCFLEEMILRAQGGAQGNIGKNDILSYSTKITVNIDEQIAISRVLSDFDREIDTLAIRRDKFQKIKQGMMQQLLTGKIRLI